MDDVPARRYGRSSSAGRVMLFHTEKKTMSSWKLTYKAKSNVITASLGLYDEVELLGATCPVTLRVGATSLARTFRILPPENEKAHIIVLMARTTHMRDLKVIHVIRDGDKLIAVEDPEDPDKAVGADKDFVVYGDRIEATSLDVRFTSSKSASPNVRVADASSILKFVAGIITHEQLIKISSAARREIKLAARCRHFEQVANDLEQQLKEAQGRLAQIHQVSGV